LDPGLPLRLAGGPSDREGRVEVYINNEWGTVSDSDWDQNEAKVVCESLGYSRLIISGLIFNP
jgi:serine protease 12 (motopsin)